MQFRQFVEDSDTWDTFEADFFIGEFEGQSRDFDCWLRNRDLSRFEVDYQALAKLFADWKKSKRRGRWCDVIDRKRRQNFTPGRFWAPTPSGVYLNKNFVKGWGGINPKNP